MALALRHDKVLVISKFLISFYFFIMTIELMLSQARYFISMLRSKLDFFVDCIASDHPNPYPHRPRLVGV